MKKLFLILLITPILAACAVTPKPSETSSAKKSPESTPASSVSLALPIAINDTLNPYTAKSKMNRELTLLMFDSLIILNKNYEPVYSLAESITQNGKTLTIKLKNAQFSDGSRVTAEDVTYSINAAQKSATSKYKSQLGGITGKSAAGTDVLTISMNRADEFFVNLLDFPIIKMNSDNLRDDDKQLLPPIGSGMYIYEKRDSDEILTINTKYPVENPKIQQISLVATPDEDALSHNIITGSISIYYTDLADGMLPSMNGAVSNVPLNSLVFLGANTKSGALKSAEIRRAISFGMDRSAVAQKSYSTYAYAAAGPYHPNFAAGTPKNPIQQKADLKFVVAELEKKGYNSKDADGFLKNSAGKRLSLKLIVNSENTARAAAASQISEQLAKAGIEVKVTSLSFSEYEKAVSNGNFDLYLGEMLFPNNMDLSSMILSGPASIYFPKTGESSSNNSSAGSSSSPNTSGNSSDLESNNSNTSESEIPSLTSAEYYAKLINGDGEISEFIDIFNNEMPIIPVCYRCGVVASHLTFTEKLNPGANNIFASVPLDRIRSAQSASNE